MTNKEKFLAGHVFQMGSCKYKYELLDNGHMIICQIEVSGEYYYCGVDAVKASYVRVYSFFFSKAVSDNLSFDSLNFVKSDE